MSHSLSRYPVGKISKSPVRRSAVLLVWHSNDSVILSKIHSNRLLFQRFFPSLRDTQKYFVHNLHTVFNSHYHGIPVAVDK